MPRPRGTSRPRAWPTQPPGPIAPRCIKAPKDGVDVTTPRFGFDEHLSEGRHASDRRSSTRRRCPAGITNPPFPLIMGRREKSARPLALGATYENISTSMTGTKCITRAHKGVTKGSLKVSEMLQRTELVTALLLVRE